MSFFIILAFLRVRTFQKVKFCEVPCIQGSSFFNKCRVYMLTNVNILACKISVIFCVFIAADYFFLEIPGKREPRYRYRSILNLRFSHVLFAHQLHYAVKVLVIHDHLTDSVRSRAAGKRYVSTAIHRSITGANRDSIDVTVPLFRSPKGPEHHSVPSRGSIASSICRRPRGLVKHLLYRKGFLPVPIGCR